VDVNIANIGTYYCWGVQLDIVIRHCIIEKRLQTFNVYFVALESKWLNNGVYEKYD
jgi:isocitrate dehydrogenase kinase/phosphatase